MDCKTALEKLEALRKCLDKARKSRSQQSDTEYDELCIRYGEVEEIIARFAGIQQIEVPRHGVTTTYPNYIEAGYLSGRTIHEHEGHAQLLKVIGKVRQLAEDPTVPQAEPSITVVVQSLRRLRECCQYIKKPPEDERGVQDILWIMLRSQFERVEREDTLPRFGAKTYKPDFGIPDLRVLVEVKFIGTKTGVSTIQESILADIPGYLSETSHYDGIIVLVYDRGHKLRDPRKFIEDLRSVEGIIEVIVVPGISM